MVYRPQIDGLRAIAVLSVIFYHLDTPFFGGGFVGVDIFFVISGFLISSIILEELSKTGEFGFKIFYIRRIRRLFPALFAVLFVSTAVAVWLFSSHRLAEFGLELVFSSLSVSNLYFWVQSGYFDVNADSKSLLHMWSLSVEEQFYLIWPLTLVLAYTFLSKKLFATVCFLIFSTSLLLNIYLTNSELTWFKNQTDGMFYLTPFRAYEFLIGAFGVWLIKRIPSNQLLHEIFFLVGVVAVSTSIYFFSQNIYFPYYHALLPCIGALLLIISQNSILSRVFLANKITIFIGLISYSLYLVHWPTIVFFKYYRFSDLSILDMFTVLAITLSISALIYFFIEKPFRLTKLKDNSSSFSKPQWSNKFALNSCLIALFISLTSGLILIASSGFSSYKNEVFSNQEITQGKKLRFSLLKDACKTNNLDSNNCHSDRSTQVLVFGNSHEVDGYNMFHKIYNKDKNVNLILFGSTNHCDLSVSNTYGITSKTVKYNCNNRAKLLNKESFIKSLNIIIYSSNKPFAWNKLSSWSVLKHLQHVNPKLKIVVLGSYFNTRQDCSDIANRFGTTKACTSHKYIKKVDTNEVSNITNAKLNDIVKNLEFTYISKYRILCEDINDSSTCLSRSKYEPMFYDQHHLSLGFSRLLSEKISETYGSKLLDIGL